MREPLWWFRLRVVSGFAWAEPRRPRSPFLPPVKPFLESLKVFFVSLRLTVVLLILSMLLVFVATLDQVNRGVGALMEVRADVRRTFRDVCGPGERRAGDLGWRHRREACSTAFGGGFSRESWLRSGWR